MSVKKDSVFRRGFYEGHTGYKVSSRMGDRGYWQACISFLVVGSYWKS